jgi:anti-sigma factor (TIGR02949 family)
MGPETGRPFENCKELFALLSEYLDEELPADTCEQIRLHIAGCPPCVEFVNSLQRSVQLVRGYSAGEAPGPLPDAARDELRATYRRMLAARAKGRG